MNRLVATLFFLALTTPRSAQWISLPTPGIPRAADGAPDLSGPAPRTADGRPDFTGLWRTGRTGGDLSDRSKFQPWINTLIEARDSRYFADNPRFHCLPSGPAAINSGGNSYGLRRILQHPTMIAVLYNDGSYREIFMDGRELEENPLPTWMGYSVGRWEGDTLVIDTVGFPAQYRVHRLLDDPKAYTRPWTASWELPWSESEMVEYLCAENPRGYSHIVGPR